MYLTKRKLHKLFINSYILGVAAHDIFQKISNYPNIKETIMRVCHWHLFHVFLLLQDILLLLLFRGGQPHGLLPLIIHHLLHHTARLTVQIWQLRRFHLKTRHGMKGCDSSFCLVIIQYLLDTMTPSSLNMLFEINPWSKTSQSWLGDSLRLPWNSLGKFSWCWFQGLWPQTCSTTPFCLSGINVHH